MFIYVDGIYRYFIDDVSDVPLKSKFISIYRGSSSATLPEGKSCPKLKNAKGIWATYLAFGDCPASNLGAKMFKMFGRPSVFEVIFHECSSDFITHCRTRKATDSLSFTQMFGNGVPILI